MTNEQAIAELQKEHDLIQGEHDLDGSQFAPALLEALAMAIEVMSGKGDTISRQAAIDVADAVWSVTGDKNVAKVWDQIKDLPSAQPERKRGEWTKDCACEICGFKPWYERDIHTLSFCPNCGADMR